MQPFHLITKLQTMENPSRENVKDLTGRPPLKHRSIAQRALHLNAENARKKNKQKFDLIKLRMYRFHSF